MRLALLVSTSSILCSHIIFWPDDIDLSGGVRYQGSSLFRVGRRKPRIVTMRAIANTIPTLRVINGRILKRGASRLLTLTTSWLTTIMVPRTCSDGRSRRRTHEKFVVHRLRTSGRMNGLVLLAPIVSRQANGIFLHLKRVETATVSTLDEDNSDC